MKLIIGGAYQGKLNYSLEMMNAGLSQVAEGGCFTMQEMSECTIMNHFHRLVKKRILDDHSVEDICKEADFIIEKNPDIVILCNEVGYGIVPAEEKERAYREAVGRVCCYLSDKAQEVYRVVSGVATKVK